MLLINKPNGNYTARQLKLPLEIEKLIDISDPVYTFCEVKDHIDLSVYFVEEKGYKTGRPRCDAEKLLKVILFAFMEHGFCSLREIEKLCRTDIRYMYLLDEMKAPSFATFGNFIRNELTDTIEQIFADVNAYIFEKDHVDLDHTYIDGTKIEANANKYTCVWKKSCIKNRDKMFVKISELIDGSLISIYDVDYYIFTCEKTGRYRLFFEHENLTKDDVGWNIDVLDENSAKVIDETIQSTWKKTVVNQDVYLTEGNTYYIAVSGSAIFSDADYKLKLEA